MTESPSDSPPLTWLDSDALWAMEAAIARAGAEGRGPEEGRARARAALLAIHPAIPAEVAEAALRGLDDLPRPPADAGRLRPADPATLEAVLSYALRYDARGKPLRGGAEVAAHLAAGRIAEHLRRARLVVLQLPPTGPHGTG